MPQINKFDHPGIWGRCEVVHDNFTGSPGVRRLDADRSGCHFVFHFMGVVTVGGGAVHEFEARTDTPASPLAAVRRRAPAPQQTVSSARGHADRRLGRDPSVWSDYVWVVGSTPVECDLLVGDPTLAASRPGQIMLADKNFAHGVVAVLACVTACLATGTSRCASHTGSSRSRPPAS
jgi:hypothetical protein